MMHGQTKIKILYVSKVHVKWTDTVWKKRRYPNESCHHLQIPMDTVSKEISTFKFPFIGN